MGECLPRFFVERPDVQLDSSYTAGTGFTLQLSEQRPCDSLPTALRHNDDAANVAGSRWNQVPRFGPVAEICAQEPRRLFFYCHQPMRRWRLNRRVESGCDDLVRRIFAEYLGK